MLGLVVIAENSQNPLTKMNFRGKIKCLKVFEQEPVTVASGIRELSVGARQLLDLGEFLLQAAGLKLVAFKDGEQVDCAGKDRYIFISVSALNEALFVRIERSSVVSRPC